MKYSPFLTGYMLCALWSSTDESDESGGEPMDANYGFEDIAPGTVADMRADCAAFLFRARHLIASATEDGYTFERAGHDFWLTRNGHGAGFWDRDELQRDGIGKQLTDLAHAAGEVWLYVGDDGRIYQ